MDDLKECGATPTWAITVPASFEEVDNGNSWQAVGEARQVYVSALTVKDRTGRVPAAKLHAAAATRLPLSSQGDAYRVENGGVSGEARLLHTQTGLELRGFMCFDGNVATCVISFMTPEEVDWAISTWKSLRPRARRKQWWPFW